MTCTIGPKLRRFLTAACFLSLCAGCGDTTSRSSGYVDAADRRIEYSIDENTDLHAQSDGATIKFGHHTIRVEKERLLIDDKESAKIGAAVRKVEVLVSKDTLTVMADGTKILTTKITR